MFEPPKPHEHRAPPTRSGDDSSGQSLDGHTRARFSRAMGRPVPDVRIHADAAADREARDAGARAFTQGRDISFRSGHYRPGTVGGDALLAHELAHAMQQDGASIDEMPVASGAALEHDADEVAMHTVAHLAGMQTDGEAAPSMRSGLRLARCDFLFGPSEDSESASTPTEEAAKTAANEEPPAAAEPELIPETPEERQRRIFGEEGDTFIEDARTWMQGNIEEKQRLTEKRRKMFADKKWGGVDEDKKIKGWTKRIEKVRGLRTDFDTAINAVQTMGADVLVLANVVYNEAGGSNDAAKRAVAYAWLNRTGGAVREPQGDEISHYESLPTRWAGLDEAGKLTFIEQFIPSIDAARGRLADGSPATNDPTGGATHWVSPKGLSKYDASKASHVAERYSRTVGSAKDRAFPNWARDPTSTEGQALVSSGAAGADYAEVEVTGVPRTEFLFYRDVR